ncbi:MAG: hypothetical protein ABWX90_03150 [Candidatus Saccharimonadales bacterium]
MMKAIRNWIAALLFVTTIGGAAFAVAVPQTTYAACTDRLLTFPAWYRGVQDSSCNIQDPSKFGGKESVSNFIWIIALNIVEMILQLVGYIAVGFIIVGGYKYMISAGSPDGMVKARKTITNAVVGLLISIFSVAIVNVIAGAIK